MTRNAVQFQKGLSEAKFEEVYGTEKQCRAIIVAARWPNGLECPGYGGRAYSDIKTRGLFKCSDCQRQTSPTSRTIFV
jgi:hypothetical protein